LYDQDIFEQEVSNLICLAYHTSELIFADFLNQQLKNCVHAGWNWGHSIHSHAITTHLACPHKTHPFGHQLLAHPKLLSTYDTAFCPIFTPCSTTATLQDQQLFGLSTTSKAFYPIVVLLNDYSEAKIHHRYPTDLRAKSVDTQFLWGPALLISPVLVEKATELIAYLPSDTWYDYYTGKKEATSGTEVTWNTPLEKINLHVRGGYILPQQIEGLNTKLRFENKNMIQLQR
jgi:hypothetical protein